MELNAIKLSVTDAVCDWSCAVFVRPLPNPSPAGRMSQKGRGAPCPYDLRFRNGVSRYSVSLILNYLQRPKMVVLTWTRVRHHLLRHPRRGLRGL